MATARNLISRAFRTLGLIKPGDAMPEADYAEALAEMNSIMESLSNSADFAFCSSQAHLILSGQQTVTIGPTGVIVTKRPIKIQSAYVDRNGISYPVSVIDGEQYDALTYKAQQGANTQAIYYDATYPDGTIYLYPIADGCTLHMSVLQSVKQFASTSVSIDMPEGYEDAIMLALAIRMAPSYGKQVNPDTKQAARRAMNAIKVTNQVIPTMDLPDAVMGRSGSSFASFMSGG